MPSRILHIAIAFAILGTCNCDPTCKTNFDDNVICSPGDQNYILKKGLVSGNNKTKGITLRGCRISSIEQESFLGLPSLLNLNLAENQINNLEVGVLDGARQLAYLNLSYNLITDLPLGLFDKLTNLEGMDLRGNTIISLKSGVFDALVKLNNLDLSANKIVGKDWNVYVFDKIRQINTIDFSRNNMDSSPNNLLHSFEALKLLNLDRCLLKMVPEFATRHNLGSMTHLTLSTNQIRSIKNPSTFVNLVNLEILDLTSNEIEELDENVFKSLKSLKTILLRQNRLTTIPDTIFQNIPKLWKVDLAQNKLVYIPVNAFRGAPLRILNLSYNSFTYLQDNFCLELKNSGARLAKFYFNNNPWQCACLLNLFKEINLYKIEYNYEKFKGDKPVCVTSKQFVCNRQPVSTK